MTDLTYNEHVFKCEYVAFPAPTLDYLVITSDKLNGTAMLCRTFEDGERLIEYIDRLVYVGTVPAIIVKKDISDNEAFEEAKRLQGYLVKNYEEAKKREI